MKVRAMRRIYLREAFCVLLMVRLTVRFARPNKVFAWAGRPPQRVRRFVGDEIGWVCWGIETVASKGWISASSVSRALAVHWMLRRRGISSRLCLGVASDGKALATHSWVEVGQTIVFGNAGASRSTRLATFGGSRR
jgi:Transglutaminase-like superfamily